MEGELRMALNTDWIFILLLCVSFLAVFSQWVFHKNFRAITQNLNNYIELKDNKISFSLFFHILFAALIALFAWQFVEIPMFLKRLSPFYLFCMIMAVILLYFLLHFFVSSLVFYSAQKSDNYSELLSKRTYFLFRIFIPLIILLFLIYFSYLPQKPLIYIFLACVIFPTILEYFYPVPNQNGNNKIPLYYFILYLCALEILPFLLLLKYGLGWEII